MTEDERNKGDKLNSWERGEKRERGSLRGNKTRRMSGERERERKQFFLVPNVFFSVCQRFVRVGGGGVRVRGTVPLSQTRLASDLDLERTESEQITEDCSAAQTLS